MNTTKIFVIFFTVTAISLLFVNVTVASPGISLNSNQSHYHLGPYIEILEDENRDILLEEISNGLYDDAFFQFDGNVPSFGYTSTAYWARITIENSTDNKDWYIQITYPPLDHVQLYVPQANGSFSLKETGDLLPFSTREFPHRNFIFRLDLAEKSSNTFYLHVDTEGSMQIPIVLSDHDTLLKRILTEYFILGLYYGIGLIMIFYNLFLFFSLRLSSYIWYALLILCILLVHFSLNGLSYQYLWQNASWWNNRGILFFMATSNLIALLFTRSFLNTKIYTPRLNTVLNWLMVIQVILLIILLFNYEMALNFIMGTMILLVVLVASIAIISWIRGVKPAKYFFFGWIIFLIGITISSLSDMGIIPITFLTKYASQIGSGIEIALFSLALGAKIKWLRLEKEALEQQAMRSQQLAVKHLEQANQVKDEFLANTSHELRTPLQGIIGIAESLQDRNGLDQEWKDNLALIVSSGERLSHLINDLLDASKLKYHELSLDIEPIKLWEVTEAVCQVSTVIYEKPIIIKNNVPVDLPLIAVDEMRLQQILYNLLSNALKYTHKGEVQITAEENDEHVSVSVRDTGIGISKDDLKVIFDSFKRGTNIEEVSVTGTGLGLNITRQLVALHGGEVSIESILDTGTTVSFTVPIYNERSDVDSQTTLVNPDVNWQQKVANEFAHSSQDNSTGKILLVDDESLNVHVLYNHLRFANYETFVAYDGEQALEMIQTHPDFDLVILDVMLPKLSGFQVAKQIRESYSFTELPILMLTAKSQTQDIIAAFNAGANDYLTKPCSKEEFLARTNTLLSLKLVMQEVTEVNNELQQLNQTLESEVQKRTEKLKKNTIKLEQINTSRRQLMTNISHELGTPMTSVKGYIKAMLDGVIDSNNEKYIRLVYQKILFIERLIQDLYELARLESRQVSFNWEYMNVADFLIEYIKPYEIDIKSNGLKFSFNNHIPQQDEYMWIVADFYRIEQVMQNLIFNAIRHTDKGGTIKIKSRIIEKVLNISLEGKSANHYLQISVCDTGIGMKPEALKHVFERFFKEDKFNTTTDMNTGLGLNIAKEVITYHNGSLWAESEFGEGSCFHYMLPLNLRGHEGVTDFEA